MKNTSGSGCGTVLIVLLIMGFISIYWPVILGIIVVAIIIYALCKWISGNKKYNEKRNTIAETYGVESTNYTISEKNFVSHTDNEVTLSAGRYIGGRDLDMGIYNLLVISGSGIVETDIPNKFYEFLSYEESNRYNNLEITQGTVLKVGTGMKIRLYDRRDSITVEPVRYSSENEKDNKSINFDNMDGHTFEHFCAEVLSKNGYQNIHVTRGSGDQGVDILADRDGIKYAIQCKNYSQPVGNKAVQEIYTGMRFYRCHVGIVMTNNTFTRSAIELAKENGIILWDRDFLMKFLNISETNDISSNDIDVKIENHYVNTNYDFKKSKKEEYKMYDKENGIFPPGRYLIGRDLPLGGYLFKAKDGKNGSVILYRNYNDCINEEDEILWDSFSDDYFISLVEEGQYICVENADIKRM